MPYRVTSAIAVLLTAVSPQTYAHHGFAPHYDREQPVLVEGTITEFRYINPHSFVYVEVEGADGSTVTRWCEMQAGSQLRIKGVTSDSLRVGDPIRIEGFQAKRDPLGCEFATGYLADGSVLELRTSGGQSLFSAPLQLGDSTSIFGMWFRKSFPGAGTDPDPAEHYTPAGAAAAAANDRLISNPVYRCSPVSLVRAWSQPGLPTEIRNEGDRVIVHHEFMDTERVIHLDMDTHPADAPRTEIGHSIGRFEGDDLIVHTAMLSEGLVRDYFVRTPNMEFTERFHVNPASGDLEITWTATDPEYYDATLEGSRILARTTLPMGRYDCIPGIGHGAQMDLDRG